MINGELAGGWALPLWKIWVRQIGWLFPISGKIIQMFQTTNQNSINLHCCWLNHHFPMVFLWVFLWFYQPVKFPAIATYCAPPEGWGRFGESAPQRASPRCLGGTSTQSLRTATGATGAPGWIDGVYWILMGFLLWFSWVFHGVWDIFWSSRKTTDGIVGL